MQVSNRSILKCSLNTEAQKLYELTSNKHDCIINDITYENGLERHQVKTKCKRILLKKFKETTRNNFWGLKEQSTIVSSVVNSSFAKDITNWQNAIKRLPVNIHNFSHKYLIFNLANNSNLFH